LAQALRHSDRFAEPGFDPFDEYMQFVIGLRCMRAAV
jgi:hypothetical protein